MGNLISPNELYKIIDSKNVIMVDVEEYFGKEPNNLFGETYYQYEALTPDIMETHKDKNVVVYCNHGISSRFFARQPQAKYPNHKVMTLDGGSDALTKDAGMSCALANILLKMPMMIKFIVAMFLSLVAASAQQGNPEDYTKSRINRIQSIQDNDIKNAVTKLMTKILLDPNALGLINTTNFTSAQEFLRDKTDLTPINGVDFQDFGIAITNILNQMSPGELEKLNQLSAVPGLTWYQNVIYILWGIKFFNQLELAKSLFHIDPESLRQAQAAISASDSAFFPAQGRSQILNQPNSTETETIPLPKYFAAHQPTSSRLRTNSIAASSLAASSLMHMPAQSIRGAQEPIPSNDLMMIIETNVTERQAHWKNMFIEDDNDNYMIFKSLYNTYQSLDNLIKYITSNKITQDYNHMKNNRNPDKRAVDRVTKNYESIAAFMGEKMDYQGGWEKIYQLFLDKKGNILNEISFYRDRMKTRLTQWLLDNKDNLKTKINRVYQEIEYEMFMDFVDVKPLSDQYSHSTESNVLANIGTLRIADVFGLSGYQYAIYFDNLNDFANRVDKFSSLMPEKRLGDKQKVMIVSEIIKTMRHMKTYHNTLTLLTKTFTYKADADGVIWNSHLLVLSLNLAIERGLFDHLEDPSFNKDGKITMTIVQTLAHFYELLEKPHDDLLEFKLIKSRRTILDQYRKEIRTYAGVSPTAAAAAGSSVKRGREDDPDDPSKRFYQEYPTIAPASAHNPRAPR